MNETAGVTFHVHGTPQPAGSKTHGRRKDGSIFTRDANPKAADWKRAVAEKAGEMMAGKSLLTGPLRLTLYFEIPRPTGHFGTGKNHSTIRRSAPRFPTVKPDVLKLARACEDAMTGIVYRDDAQIVQEHIQKDYGEQAKVIVIVEEIVT